MTRAARSVTAACVPFALAAFKRHGHSLARSQKSRRPAGILPDLRFSRHPVLDERAAIEGRRLRGLFSLGRPDRFLDRGWNDQQPEPGNKST